MLIGVTFCAWCIISHSYCLKKHISKWEPHRAIVFLCTQLYSYVHIQNDQKCLNPLSPNTYGNQNHSSKNRYNIILKQRWFARTWHSARKDASLGLLLRAKIWLSLFIIYRQLKHTQKMLKIYHKILILFAFIHKNED